MLKDVFFGFTKQATDKVRNPFLGTYLGVWLIRNWELVYRVFNFESNFTLDKRVEWIKQYYATNDFVEGVWANVGWTFLILLITYILLNIARVLSIGSEKLLYPWLSSKLVEKSVVTNEDHKLIVEDRKRFKEELEKTEKENVSLNQQNQKLKAELTDYQSQNSQNQLGVQNLTVEVRELKEENKQLKKRIDYSEQENEQLLKRIDSTEQVNNQLKIKIDAPNQAKELKNYKDVIGTLKAVEKKGLVETFKNIANNIASTDHYYPDTEDEFIDAGQLADLELLKRNIDPLGRVINFELSQKGQTVIAILN